MHVHACLRACVRACVRTCARAFEYACEHVRGHARGHAFDRAREHACEHQHIQAPGGPCIPCLLACAHGPVHLKLDERTTLLCVSNCVED
eukprot:10247082-Lingulodinium_polyedra.AAC.1